MAEVAVFAWLLVLTGCPLAVVLASYTRLSAERVRTAAVWSAAVLLLWTLAALVVPAWTAFEWHWPGAPHRLLGTSALRMDVLSSVLLPFTAGLWFLTVAVTPRARLDGTGLRRTALVTLVTLASFLTVSPLALVVLWIVSIVVFLAGMAGPEHRHAWRVAAVYLGASSLFLALGVWLVAFSHSGSWWHHVGVWLLVAAAIIRKGVFPAHAWMPEVLDRGRIGPTVLFSAPQIGTYVAVVLILPEADATTLRVVAALALATAVHGAALALVQRDARRACGYLFVSQSALVMAGLDCTSVDALCGALLLWISSGVAFAGLARCVLVLEARRGRLDLSRHHGGHDRMPLLAASFLLMGLACTGFPGTLGFVGGELLVGGAVAEFPVLGFGVVVAGALTGLAVLRMYFSLFCGARDESVHLQLVRREAWMFAAVAAFLLGTGLAPGPLVASRAEAAARVRPAHMAEEVFPVQDPSAWRAE